MLLKKYSAQLCKCRSPDRYTAFGRRSGQFSILKEFGKCELGDCFILYFKINHSPPGTQLEYFWNQPITVVRIS